MGAIVKGVGSLIGGGKRRREQTAANKEFGASKAAAQSFDFSAPQLGATSTASTQGYQATQQQVGQLGPAAQAQVAQLGEAQGYDAQGYDAQGYEAERAQAAQLGPAAQASSEFTNPFQAAQVATGAAELQAAESDEALAAALESGAITGAGGATALAQQAAKSKQGIGADIQRQEQQNQQAAAAGQQQLEAQRASQDQFNVGAQNQFSSQQAQLSQQANLANQSAANQASQFTAQAQNQAGQFSAQAQNQAAQFGAQAANQFSLSQFGAQNAANLANAQSQNQFALSQFGAENQAAANNAQAANQAAQFSAGAANSASQFNAQQQNAQAGQQAQLEQASQQQQYNQLRDQLNLAGDRKASADQARAQATNDLVGGIAGVAGAFLSDERLKENVVKVGESESGLNIYHFNYKDIPTVVFEGVMAQEVPSDAKVELDNGYLGVNYDVIDVELKVISGA